MILAAAIFGPKYIAGLLMVCTFSYLVGYVSREFWP